MGWDEMIDEIVVVFAAVHPGAELPESQIHAGHHPGAGHHNGLQVREESFIHSQTL